MSIEVDLAAALGALVEGRCYPNTFKQHTAWPAIRFQIISPVPDLTVCGDGGDETAETRIQIDIVHSVYDSARSLRLQVMAAMQTFALPAVNVGGFDDYDPEIKGHRCSLDYVLHASSVADTP